MTDTDRTRRGAARLVGLIALLLWVGLPIPAKAAGALEQLQAFVSGTTAARGAFTQRTVRGAGRSEEVATGVFAFSRPGLFRWEVRKPFEQLMVADGDRLYFYDRDLNQVTVRSLAGALGSSPAAILFGASSLERDFTLSEAGGQGGLEWLDAAPKSREAGFERIRIGFREGLPVAMEVVDAFGGTTRFAFSAIERGAAFPPGTFRFTPPKGADVITQ